MGSPPAYSHTNLLAILKNIYDNDKYALIDGCKRAQVHPKLGVKQGCTLSPTLFSLYISDVDCLADNVQGAVTEASDVQVMLSLYADDLCLTANHPTELQIMLDRLYGYAQRNASKAEVVHFNSKGNNVPTLTLGGAQLVRAESFKLGVVASDNMHVSTSLQIGLLLCYGSCVGQSCRRSHGGGQLAGVDFSATSSSWSVVGPCLSGQ
eukprot:1150854-Pelagomonas_calceolata.AAC.1